MIFVTGTVENHGGDIRRFSSFSSQFSEKLGTGHVRFGIFSLERGGQAGSIGNGTTVDVVNKLTIDVIGRDADTEARTFRSAGNLFTDSGMTAGAQSFSIGNRHFSISLKPAGLTDRLTFLQHNALIDITDTLAFVGFG